ncbi:hypothetical protein GOY14_00525 [Wolbachia endosymbiont of Dipetalonema caudispina]|uniref:hypothetical protein n=1 Tax=Wolbachia endosymbiont of Dipetalonema caudispina TaxID=1812112 RepID=UPI00158CD9C5|nr:hypothetical protein [Wolbachia endosymbiont of Dipetalonema caudispina]QKX00852.1 hypothetical protein GOY14_00525 [Wolbachia endosymbiont of Dipetalonema caudispina]
MYIQLNRVFVFIALLSFNFVPYSSKANLMDNELKNIQKIVKNFASSFLAKDTIKNMSPSTIIGLCITVVIFAIMFRGLIFLMIILFGVLIMLLGSTEKATSYLKEKFYSSKSINLQSDSKKKR